MATLEQLQSLLNQKLDKAGGVVMGDVTVKGNFYCNGFIYAKTVYGGVYNDYAEWFPRGGFTEEGDLVMLDTSSISERYVKAVANHGPLVGIDARQGMIIGGRCDIPEDAEKEQVMEMNLQEFIPICLKGRVYAKVLGKVKVGDIIVPSDIAGVGKVDNNAIMDIAGRSMQNNDNEYVKLVLIKV